MIHAAMTGHVSSPNMDKTPPKGKLWLDGAQKEDLIKRWSDIVESNKLDVRLMEPLEEIKKEGDYFEIKTPKSILKAKKIRCMLRFSMFCEFKFEKDLCKIKNKASSIYI